MHCSRYMTVRQTAHHLRFQLYILKLQVEAIEDVERCFVHVDFQTRDEPEHKASAARWV